MSEKKKIAHLTGEDSKEQSILDHLENVAEMAAKFSKNYNIGKTDASAYAYTTGLSHDVGKYSALFQKKIRGNAYIQVDHSTAGAKEMMHNKMMAASFAVAGHHGGIPNGKDTKDNNLIARVQRREIEPYDDYKKEVSLKAIADPQLPGFQEAFFTRMIFSSLVDADYLDTENFMQQGGVKRSGYDSNEKLYQKFREHIGGWLVETDAMKEINRIRTGILKQCIEKGAGARGLYSLTVPTGGGKTVSSMAFAMEQLKQNKMDRIIYVIPYTSIIEQNAKVFRDIFGVENVVEHHSNAMVENDKKQPDDVLRLHQLSVENWDAPIIVTTNVQFFESLFSNKTSRCRKLHNIANSVIIFDEAQMIPLDYLKPCVSAIKELIEHYKVTAVMCTATQPALDKWFEPLKMTEICENHAALFEKMKRAEIQNMGQITKEELGEKMRREPQILTIVNRRKTAQEVYNMLSEEGTYHLSTYMTPVDRKKTMSIIKERLLDGKECRVISTSLVEAGVDMDFPKVYREKAGLDSIIQAAGRCNREGKRKLGDSIVSVFELEGKPLSLIQKNISMMEETLQKYGAYDSIEAIRNYFRQLQLLDEESLDHKKIIAAFNSGLEGIMMPFEEVSNRFKLIDTNTKSVLIPEDTESEELINLLQDQLKNGENFKQTLRKLSGYTLNVYEDLYQEMLNEGNTIYEILDGVAILQNLQMYNIEKGLCHEKDGGVLMI